MIRDLINTGNNEKAGAATGVEQITLKLKHAQIRIDGGTQMRAGVNEVTAGEYADEIRRGVEFPPVIVFHDGQDYWLADGFHRVRAYFMAGGHMAEIPCEVRPGTRRDAVLWAAGANANHGIRRTRQDKERAVDALLADEEWGQWADREIARRCNVSPTFVGQRRKIHTVHVDSMNGNEPTERTFIHPKTGQPATMNVAGQQERISYAPVWMLEQAVQRAIEAFWRDDESPDVAGNLRALMKLPDWEKEDLGRAILQVVDGKFDYRKRELVQAINNVRSRHELASVRSRLSVKETEAVIWQVLEQETNKEPAAMLAWLNSERGNAVATYERHAAGVIGAGEFWAAERLVRNRLTEMVAADESRAAAAERWGDPDDADPRVLAVEKVLKGQPEAAITILDDLEQGKRGWYHDLILCYADDAEPEEWQRVAREVRRRAVWWPAPPAIDPDDIGDDKRSDLDDDPPTQPATRQLTPEETEAVIWRVLQRDGGEGLDEQKEELARRTRIEDYAHAINQGLEFNDQEFGLALLRVRKQLADRLVERWKSAPHVRRQREIQAEIEFWAGAQKRIERVGELTGKWTGPPSALGRAIGDVIRLLQEDVIE